MTWVDTPRDELPNVLASHSPNERVLRAHVALCRTIIRESGLTRVERESVAVAVSAANDCHY